MQQASFRQPCHALVPSAFTLDAVEQWVLERASGGVADRFRLTSFWHVDYFRHEVPGELKRRYTMRLAQAENYGVAFGSPSPLREVDRALLGEDSREILKGRHLHDNVDRTAVIDLVMGQVTEDTKHKITLDQALPEKYALRSRLFADEAAVLLRQKGSNAIKGSRPHVLVIGASAGMIGALVDRGFNVSATDMIPDAIGKNICGVTICAEPENDRLIAAADLAIITGMTLPNCTLPALMEASRTHNTSTMMWAITGRNFGQYYIDQGIDCVISDPSPFFLLPGPANIGIWRRAF